MEASDLIGKQWTCPQCKTNEVINASGIDHKCSNCHVILPLEKIPWITKAEFDFEKYRGHVPIFNEEELYMKMFHNRVVKAEDQ